MKKENKELLIKLGMMVFAIVLSCVRFVWMDLDISND